MLHLGYGPLSSEKEPVQAVHGLTGTPSSEIELDIVKDWDREERAIRRKIDFILLPVLALAFFALQLDRGNISSALTSTITEDLHITTNQINIGTQLLSAGIVLTELPSNVILQKIGPQKWISGQLIACCLVATFQAFITTYPAYLATRLLLGLFEGGFIPGALYYISTWYKREGTSVRISLFFFGQMFASATSTLISAGVLNLSGRNGLAGWRWIFLVEGLITIFIAMILTLFLPPSVGNGKPLISGGRWSYFTPRETHIIQNRVLLDDPRKARGGIKITGRDIWNAVRQPQIIQHFFVSLVSMSGFQGLTMYTPSLIKSFGFSATRANALDAVPVYCGIVWLVMLAYLGDKTEYRGLSVLISITWNVITYACLRTMAEDASKWHKYALMAVSNVSYASMQASSSDDIEDSCCRSEAESRRSPRRPHPHDRNLLVLGIVNLLNLSCSSIARS